uniref:Filamin B n=2 Tax=Odontoceti TaxID=9722 RepID=A0A8C6BSW0_MONMO
MYTPMAPGSYLIGVKYGGPNHIVGSPFKAKVTGQRLVSPGSANETSSILVESVTRSSTETCYSAIPKASSDASKVTSKGAGLSKAFVGQKSSFLVDCSKAGSNMLLIGVHGPTTPCEEVSMKHVGNQQYSVTYIVKEKGDYVLAVKWERSTSLAAPSMSRCLKTVLSSPGRRSGGCFCCLFVTRFIQSPPARLWV